VRQKAYIRTFGCQMNTYDTGRMTAALATIGYDLTPRLEDADLILLNSCAIRAKAEHKAVSELGTYREFKERRPGVLIGLGGCVAQASGERLLRRTPYVDFVFGTQAIARLPEIVERVRTTGRRTVDVALADDLVVEDGMPEPIASGVTAFVAIMRGCDNYCAYCVVPYVRGREISRDPDDVVREIETLAGRGVREVTLLGQNVNSYGKGRADAIGFSGLLRRVAAIDGLARVRFVTSHPRDFGADLIDAMAGSPKVCEHLHLPVQSGSDRVLAAMRRGYTAAEYAAKAAEVREKIPGIALTTDVIVGFPGETEDDFAATVDLLECVRFAGLFAFRYSARPGTTAARLPDDVPDAEKRRRLGVVLARQREIAAESRERIVGRTVEVLVEGRGLRDPDQWTGRTRDNRIVNFVGGRCAPGDVVAVRIERALENSLSGSAPTPAVSAIAPVQEVRCSSR
jgi:tRNA-2-methylthio-N6-dimethylallyladenosine synthase